MLRTHISSRTPAILQREKRDQPELEALSRTTEALSPYEKGGKMEFFERGH